MRLAGKNAVLKGALPLIRTASSISIGVDVERGRYGMCDQPAFAAAVASTGVFCAIRSACVSPEPASQH
ncbi:hypothetical protein GN244_ATG00493 [Phytophthora infestans]|uniref:Uncharacterized protein n=1 Tax=Phytophthora infestans TaxID=4787 RepID=A0A833T3J6_PHYIN|nr:hypothetical protein GN244_ATG00491 [Phytophthora infestans]KAF4046969.1 hypothetical protein GN244_ATG00493 [Phytophthora infestans]